MTDARLRVPSLLPAVSILAAVAGCRPTVPPPTTAPAPASSPAADDGGVRPLDATGLHNLFRVTGRVYSGGGPAGDAGFESLQRLGVKTIISVDGATPDVAAAARHGLRYVHLPVGYDGIPRDRAAALAAAAGLPGPVYVHCHHGKHRGPAAVAVMCRATDGWAADRAAAWMRRAGTDPRYAGLYAAAEHFVPPTPAERAAPAEFPAVAPVPDLTRLMVGIDARWDRLKDVKAAGWGPPPGHPDIDPPHEAMQLLEHYREAVRLEAVTRRGPEFAALMAAASAAAADLESGLRAGDVGTAAAGFARSVELCVRCHGRYRDDPTR